MIPSHSPGCYGSALAFKKDNIVCQKCPFALTCEPLHIKNLEALREKLGIKLKKQEKKKAERGINALPKKTQDLVNKIEALNIKVVSSLQEGNNPFPASMPFMRIVGHLLQKLGIVDRKLISACFATKLNWTPETAEAHSRIAIQALVHIGAIDEADGQIQVRK